jgi:hypothetical protein
MRMKAEAILDFGESKDQQNGIVWPVRKKMSHSLFEKLSDAASKKDASHQFGSLRH